MLLFTILTSCVLGTASVYSEVKREVETFRHLWFSTMLCSGRYGSFRLFGIICQELLQAVSLSLCLCHSSSPLGPVMGSCRVSPHTLCFIVTLGNSLQLETWGESADKDDTQRFSPTDCTKHTLTDTDTQTQTHRHRHRHTDTDTQTHRHTHTHTHTHTHRHTHTHTQHSGTKRAGCL